jgi:tryprostatin B 6-hydroxylase
MYGPIVRTGATHISIADSAFVEPVLGHNATPRKGAWYDIDYPYHSLHEERDPKVHEKKRGLWAPAFSDKALRGYNVQLNLVNEKFMEKVHQLEGTPIDVTKWISIYMFDVMQAVVFGRHEYLLDTGEKPPVFETMANGMAILGLVLPPWFVSMRLGTKTT